SFFIELMNIVNGQLDYATFGKLLVKRTGRHHPFIRECIEMGRRQSGRVRIAQGHPTMTAGAALYEHFPNRTDRILQSSAPGLTAIPRGSRFHRRSEPSERIKECFSRKTTSDPPSITVLLASFEQQEDA